MTGLIKHFRSGHFVDVERGIVYAKDTRKGLKRLALTVNKDGYVRVGTGTRKDRKTSSVHVLVWEAATGGPVPPGYDVHHQNSNRSDNRRCNLEALPHAANVKIAHQTKRTRKQAAGIDDIAKFAIIESVGIKSDEKWAEQLRCDVATIEHMRQGGCVDLPASIADEMRQLHPKQQKKPSAKKGGGLRLVQ